MNAKITKNDKSVVLWKMVISYKKFAAIRKNMTKVLFRSSIADCMPEVKRISVRFDVNESYKNQFSCKH